MAETKNCKFADSAAPDPYSKTMDIADFGDFHGNMTFVVRWSGEGYPPLRAFYT